MLGHGYQERKSILERSPNQPEYSLKCYENSLSHLELLSSGAHGLAFLTS